MRTTLTLLLLGSLCAVGPTYVQADETTLTASVDVGPRDAEGRKHGEYLVHHDNGDVAERATWKAGKLHGVVRTFDPGGILRSAVTWKNGELSGAHRTYDEKGVLQLDQTYRKGKLHGGWKSYHPKKKLHVSTTYKTGKLHGKYVARAPNGQMLRKTSYKEGLLHGAFQAWEGKRTITKQKWKMGEPLDVDGIRPFPRKADWMADEIARLLKGDGSLSEDPLEADRELALRYLQAYRLISDVAYDDIGVNPKYQAHAQAAAAVCKDLGHITHHPQNPGWDPDKFAFAEIGTKSSNLAQGMIACTSVRGYMDDSDQRNIGKVGHRAWCMNPKMTETGFGTVGHFSAMWSFSSDRSKVPEYDLVGCPPPGLAPAQWFGNHWAWHISMNKRTWDAPKGDIRVEVVPVDETFLPNAKPLRLSNISVHQKSVGVPYMIIFKPNGIQITPGARFRVTVDGLTAKGKPKQLRYFVEFFDCAYPTPRIPKQS